MISNYDKCKNCKYFLQHYGIDFNYIHPIRCGHCTKNISTTGGFMIYSGKQPCPYFEKLTPIKTKETKRKIEYYLKTIALDIESIKVYLNKNKCQTLSEIAIEKINKRIN